MTHRSSGVLLHPTSLPSPFGIGDLGQEAREFVDFLVSAGQSVWQVLPLGPTGYGESPYQSISAFAGHTLLIDPRQLIDERLITWDDLTIDSIDDDGRVDFGRARTFKTRVLDRAHENFKTSAGDQIRNDFTTFTTEAAWWLDDYALFCAIRSKEGDRQWAEWEAELADREPAALQAARAELSEQITAHKFQQFLFFRQWRALRGYATERGVSIFGDLPIFVAYDSADVWARREYFKLDEVGKPRVVAGVPPDYFSETGQLWGNPLYDWERLKAEGFSWWIDRLRWSLSLFDLVRIDHFRGFVACWEIPAGDATAENGKWVDVPGRELFQAVRQSLGDVPIVAENLGVITDEVESLRTELGFPGMRVLQFAFGDDTENDHLPHNYTRDSVAYTGTHDNDTTVGWFANLSEAEREFCLRYLKSSGAEINWDMIRSAVSSVAEMTVIPMQDLLGLGSEARMNTPASESGNWLWRMRTGVLNEDLAERFRAMTSLFGRIGRDEIVTVPRTQ